MKTKKLEFCGYSDDTFGWHEFDGDGDPAHGDDHDDAARMTVRAFRVASESTGQAVIVTGVYGKAPAAVWSIGIAPDEEGVEIPDWATSPRFHTYGYTPVMTLIVPADATVVLVNVDGEKPKKDEG